MRCCVSQKSFSGHMFRAVFELAHDELRLLVHCFLVVPHVARLFRLCAGAASAVLASCPRGILFFFCFGNYYPNNLKCRLVCTGTSLSLNISYIYVAQQVALFACAFQIDVSNPGKTSCFCFCLHLPLFSFSICFSRFFVYWHHVVSHQSTVIMDLIVFVSSREKLLHDKDRNGQFLRWLKVPELQQYCITHIEKEMCVHIAVAVAAVAVQVCMLLFCRCWLLLPFAIDELEKSPVKYNLQERR